MGKRLGNVSDLTFVKTPKGLRDDIEIFNQTWEVRYSPDLLEEWGCYGACSEGDRLILIDSTQAPESMKATLLHEALHACLALQPTRQGLTHEQNEEVVSALEPALLSFLRSNKAWW